MARPIGAGLIGARPYVLLQPPHKLPNSGRITPQVTIARTRCGTHIHTHFAGISLSAGGLAAGVIGASFCICGSRFRGFRFIRAIDRADPHHNILGNPQNRGAVYRLQAPLPRFDCDHPPAEFPRHRFGLEQAGGGFLFEELIEAPQEGFAVMGDWLEKNEDTAYAFCHADIKARQWLFDPANKDEAYKIMIDLGYEIPPAFVELYKVELDQISPDGGFESAEVMDDFVKELAVTGDLPEGLDWRKYVDMKYVWAAQEALGLPKRPASL